MEGLLKLCLLYTSDLDSYYVNLFARYQSRKWSHLLIRTGGWNYAKLTRTVDYGSGLSLIHISVNLGTVTNPAFSLAADTNSFINLVTPSDLTFGNRCV